MREALETKNNGQLNDEQACFSAEREHGGGVASRGWWVCRMCEEAGGSGCFVGDDGAGECAGFGLLFASSKGVGRAGDQDSRWAEAVSTFGIQGGEGDGR